MALTAEQLEARRHGIGGSDAGAVLGLNPYRSPLDVWLDKTGRMEAPDVSDLAAVHWGNVLEDVVAKEYERRTGRNVRRCNETRVHKRHPFMVANIDRLVPGSDGGILEIKTAGPYARDRWGEPGTDQVPEEYLAQCAHYMAVFDRDWCDLAVLIGGRDFRIYRIVRDDDLERVLIGAESEFWRLVQEDRPPAPRDLSDIAKRWPKDNGAIIEATPDIEDELSELVSLRHEIKELENIAKRKESEIKRYMGDNAVLSGPDGKPLATWKTQGVKRLDTKRLREELQDIAAKYTTESETRVFRINRRRNT